MNIPIVVVAESFQVAWGKAILELKNNQWELWDLIVRVENPYLFDSEIHRELEKFSKDHSCRPPNQVSYTIFPHKLVREGRTFEEISNTYYTKFFPKSIKKTHRWGTYFQRMTNYPASIKNRYPSTRADNEIVHINQLGNIITAIRNTPTIRRAAYTLQIPIPGHETMKVMGGPCLNYISVRQELDQNNQRSISFLATYRNHDFFERAYGNYYGLAKLLEYVANETNSSCGSLTCVSSHAFLQKNSKQIKTDLGNLSDLINGGGLFGRI